MILRTLSKIKRSPKVAGIRRFTNLLYYDPNTVTLDLRNFDSMIVDGYIFRASDQLNAVQRVEGNPWFEGVRPTDIVVDIGANIGAMTVPLADKASYTVAVEPLFYKELRRNLAANAISRVHVMEVAIGTPKDFKELFIQFSSKEGKVSVMSFHDLKKFCVDRWGHLDFLKMDGEGCEWEIEPEELRGIRELRIEFHIRRGRVKECKKKLKAYLDWMRDNNYEVTVDHPNYGPDPYDKEDYMVMASLKGEQ